MNTKILFFISTITFTSQVMATPADDLAFYTLPQTAKPGKHGEIIRTEQIKTDIPNAKAWKVLYWSTTIDNKTVPVSGMIIAPAKPSSAKSSPIITWGHGTAGIPRRCAPSLVTNPASDAKFYYLPNSDSEIDYGIPGLSEMIASGYVVAATDYNGLGAPGIHQYLIGNTEARNMLDAAIVARQLTGASKQTVAIGWSQGGQASVWVAQISEYAGGKINLVGAVSLAPVNALAEIKVMEKMTSKGEKLRPVSAAERMMGWYAMTVAYPELKLSDVLTPLGVEFFKQASKTQCNHQMGDTLAYLEEYKGDTVRKDPQNQDAWLKRYAENALGNIPAKVPLAVYQGDADLAVFPSATSAYVQQACASGIKISYTLYPGVDHIGLSAKAKSDFLKWIADRLAGKPAPVTCSPK